MTAEWREESRIRSYEVGPSRLAGPATLCNLLQECAGNHADHLGIGVELLQTKNMMWALARIGVEFERYPEVGEVVEVHTWLNGAKGPFAMREFAVTDARGGSVLKATYAWLAIEVTTMRTLRPGPVLAGLPPKPDLPCLDAALGKITPPGSMTKQPHVFTRQSDMDMQKHVNNARYIAWIEDTFSYVEKKDRLSWLQVNFLAEGFADQRLDIHTGAKDRIPEELVVVISRDGTDLVRAVARF